MSGKLYQQHGVPHPELFNEALDAIQSLDSAWVVIGRISADTSIGIWGLSVGGIALRPTSYECDGDNSEWYPAGMAFGSYRQSFSETGQYYSNKARAFGSGWFPSSSPSNISLQGWITTASGNWPDPPALWPSQPTCGASETPYPYHLECIEGDYVLFMAPGAFPSVSESFINCERAGVIDQNNTSYGISFSIVGYQVILNKDIVAQAPDGLEILEAYVAAEWTGVTERVIDHEAEVPPCSGTPSSTATEEINEGTSRMGLMLMGRRLNSAPSYGPTTTIDGPPDRLEWNLGQYPDLGESHEYISLGSSTGVDIANGAQLMDCTRMVQTLFDNRNKPLGDVYLFPTLGNAPAEISNGPGLIQFARSIQPEIQESEFLTSESCPTDPGYSFHLKTRQVSWDIVEFSGPILARIRLNSSTDFDALNLIAGAMF